MVALITACPSIVAANHVAARHGFTPSRPRPHAASRAIRCMADPSSCNDASTDHGRRGVVSGRRTALLSFAGIGMTLVCGNGTLALPAAAASLSSDDPAVIAALDEVFAKMVPKNKAPSALRLIFHDAGTYDEASRTGGANGSVAYELDRPENFGLNRGFRPIEKMPAMLVGTAAEGISIADLIAYGGAYATRITGGPNIKVSFGRTDATSADPEGRLPAETLSPAELKAHFKRMGFTAQELVAISGAHTIGGKGFGEPLVFDNTYYTTLLDTPWKKGKTKEELEMNAMIGLASDKMLPEDDECLRWIKLYASDQAAFFRDFEKAYIKLANLGTSLA